MTRLMWLDSFKDLVYSFYEGSFKDFNNILKCLSGGVPIDLKNINVD